jgi:hypothetical protein
MANSVASHYSKNLGLADAIAEKLRSAGKDTNKLTTTDLVAVDEFHIRGRKATLELGEKMKLNAHSQFLTSEGLVVQHERWPRYWDAELPA